MKGKLFKKIICFMMAFMMIAGMFSNMGSVSAKAADVNIVLDGSKADWLYIEPLAKDCGIFKNVSAFTTKDTLYFKFELKDSSKYMTEHIYINTDGDKTNGLYGNGADYMCEWGGFNHYEGTNGEWDGWAGAETGLDYAQSAGMNFAEFALPLKDLGNPKSIGLNIAIVDPDWNDCASCPAAANEYLTVPELKDVLKKDIVDGAAIKLDGDKTDWLNIEPLKKDCGIFRSVSGFTTKDTLYIKFELNDASKYMTEHVYINTDGDNTNGLYGNGADYMCEWGGFNHYEGTDGEWDGWVGADSSFEYVQSEDMTIVEFAIPLKDLGNPKSIGLNVAIVDDSWGDCASCPAAANEWLTVPGLAEVIKADIVDEIFVPAAEEVDTTFRGKDGQWDNVKYDAANPANNMTELKAATDGKYLYIYAAAEKLSKNYTVYIGTDAAGKNFKSTWTNGKNVGFKVGNDKKLMSLSANGKAKDTGKKASIHKSKTEVEIKVNVKDIIKNFKGSKSYEIRVAIDDGTGELLPDAGQKMLTVTTPILSSKKNSAPKITVDGDPSDWAGIKPIADGTGSLGDTYAIRTNEGLYVATYIKNVVDPESSTSYTTSLFVDTDNDPSTGYQHPRYSGLSGGNMLVQDWYSYGPLRNLEFFYTDEPVSLAWNMSPIKTSGYEKVFKPTADKTVYFAEWFVPVSAIQDATSYISDDFAICIDREDCQTDEVTQEPLTPSGYAPASKKASFAAVPKYDTTCEIKLNDKSFEDWANVTHKAVHQGVDNLYVTRTGDKLYTLVSSDTQLDVCNTYYIRTNAKKAYKYDGMSKVNFVVKDGYLYRVTGKNKLSKAICSVFMNYYKDSIEMQLSLKRIGSPKTIYIAYAGLSGALKLPEKGFMKSSKKSGVKVDKTLFYPTENNDAYNNPYTGWVAWGDIGEGALDTVAYDFDLVYVDIKWSEIEPTKGKYDFDAIEKQYQFDYWKKLGKHMVLRVVMDNVVYAPVGTKRMDIPQWLYDELEKENYEGKGAGTFYNSEGMIAQIGGVGFSPNYDSELLRKYHKALIAALAERYDDPSITAFVEIGSLGHWAEMHCWPEGSGEFPGPEIAQEYMSHYVEAFKNVKCGLRKPYAIGVENQWGLYNDVFGVADDAATYKFVDWTINGNDDMPGSTEEDVEASKCPDFWKNSYSGGEFASGNFRINAEDENVAEVLNQIRMSHTTFLGPCSGADIKTDQKKDIKKYLENSDTLRKALGYRFTLENITKLDSVKAGKKTEITMNWYNRGNAPFYYEWPLEISVLDKNGKVVYKKNSSADIRTWIPGAASVTDTIKLPKTLKAGEYTLAVAVLDPATGKPGMDLAIEGKNADGRYELYKFTVK